MARANQILVVLAFFVIGGCARAPSGGGTGTRLAITLRFAGPIGPQQDNYQYFFLIRNAADDIGRNGPIPVIQPPYLNGFATASVSQSPGDPQYTAGFTDFVEYSRVQRQVTSSGYTVYHLPGGIAGDPNRDIFNSRGEPDFTQPPNGSTTLYFEIAINRLKPDSGELDPNNGQSPRYLQVNVVATTTTPHNPAAIDPSKFLDAFGEQRLGSGTFNAFITVDAQQIGHIYQSSPNPGDPFYEPNDDTYPAPSDPGIELVGWTIQIKGQ